MKDKKVFYKADIKKDFIIRLIKEILNREENVVFAYLYGSFVEAGEFFYDIDIAVYLTSNKDPHSVAVKLREQIADVFFQSGIHGFIADNFDVKVINDAPYDFVINVLNDGLLIVDKDEGLRGSYIEHINMKYRINQIVLDEALR
jgi:predicted nucleotidyltransferase